MAATMPVSSVPNTGRRKRVTPQKARPKSPMPVGHHWPGGDGRQPTPSLPRPGSTRRAHRSGAKGGAAAPARRGLYSLSQPRPASVKEAGWHGYHAAVRRS
jgi:hypothetical protein